MIGDRLDGFCNGHFGRDSYGLKVIEAEGADWIVAREENGAPEFASFDTPAAKEEFLRGDTP
jgi:hypothetical protein